MELVSKALRNDVGFLVSYLTMNHMSRVLYFLASHLRSHNEERQSMFHHKSSFYPACTHSWYIIVWVSQRIRLYTLFAPVTKKPNNTHQEHRKKHASSPTDIRSKTPIDCHVQFTLLSDAMGHKICYINHKDNWSQHDIIPTHTHS